MICKGIVFHGEKRGREIGFPTANILNSQGIQTGIYAARITFEDAKYNGAAYIGGNRKDILEVYIFDFEGNLYDKLIEVEIVKKLRDDKLFSSFNDLLEAIKKDIEDAKSFFSTDYKL